MAGGHGEIGVNIPSEWHGMGDREEVLEGGK